MRPKTLFKYCILPVLACWLVLGGCAADDSYHLDEPQGPPSMGGGKGGGMGMGRGHRGGPPGDNVDSDSESALPAEAFIACAGKSSGDVVQFVVSTGETVQATCRVIDDHLVAVPEQEARKAPRG